MCRLTTTRAKKRCPVLVLQCWAVPPTSPGWGNQWNQLRSAAKKLVRAGFEPMKIACAKKRKFAWRLKGESAVQSPKPKIFYFCFSEIHVSITSSRLDQEGRIAIVTNVSAGRGGRRWLEQTSEPMRTAKSCGPGLPTLRLSSRDDDLADDGGKKARSPRRSRISRKTIAQGMPDDLAEPVVTAACFFCCRRAMGEAFTRHSLRPLCFRG